MEGPILPIPLLPIPEAWGSNSGTHTCSPPTSGLRCMRRSPTDADVRRADDEPQRAYAARNDELCAPPCPSPVRCHTIAAQAPPPPRHHSPRPASLYWPKVSRVWPKVSRVWPKELRERSGSRLGKVHAAVPRRCVTAPHTPSASPRRTAFRGHAGECRACAAKTHLASTSQRCRGHAAAPLHTSMVASIAPGAGPGCSRVVR